MKKALNPRAPLKIDIGHERPLWNKGLRVAGSKNIELLETPFIHYMLGLVLLIGTLLSSPAGAIEKKTPENSDQNCVLELRELMLSFAQKKQKSARFKEEKFLSFLDQPLKSEGTLHFRPPDYLEKNITKPQKERLVVESDIVKIVDQQDVSRTFSLNDYPPLKELLNGIRFTLLGKIDSLAQYYELTLNGNCHQWTLILVPKSISAMDFIDRIIFLGEKDNIEKITWVETNGDFTVMTIEKGSL